MTLNGALVVTFAMLRHLINCLIVIIICITITVITLQTKLSNRCSNGVTSHIRLKQCSEWVHST